MVKMDKFEHIGHWLFRWRSFLPLFAIPFFLIALISPRPENSPLPEGLWDAICFAVAFAGLGVRIYTVGHTPRGTSERRTKSQRADVLNTAGLYSMVRHPLYWGNFLIWVGISLFTRSLIFVAAAVIVYLLYYRPIALAEEEFLRKKFGNEFDDWAGRTPRIFPNFRNWKRPDLPFSLKTVLRREYSGFFAIIASFTAMKIVEDFFFRRRWELEWAYLVLFFIGLVVYIGLMILKKKKMLDEEGR